MNARFRLLFVTVILALVGPGAALAARPIHTAVLDPQVYWGQGVPQVGIGSDLAFARTHGSEGRGAGARFVRLYLYWIDVVRPSRCSTTPPAGFNPRAWNDPHYQWGAFDDQVRAAAARGLQVIFAIKQAPLWALERGVACNGTDPTQQLRPSPVDFGNFAFAAAERYDGTHGFPRVRYWQAWNEANRKYFLAPQREGGRLVSADHYRLMLQAFAANVRHPEHPGTTVITSGVAPYANSQGPGAMTFMKRLLCTDGSAACPKTAVPFDVWAHHPYTHGPPTEKARRASDAALGDLGRMRRALMAAYRLGRIQSNGPVKFWITEWNWDSNRPDPKAVPMKFHARWTSEAIYRMWKAGVSLAVWTQLRDYPFTWLYQGGLYSWGGSGGARDRAKLSLRAFRFPFVAFRRASTVSVWGRTPLGLRRSVLLQRKTPSGRWRTVAIVRANGYGVFSKRFRTSMSGYSHMRAKLFTRRDTSVPFALTRPRWVEPANFNLFGCGGGVSCR